MTVAIITNPTIFPTIIKKIFMAKSLQQLTQDKFGHFNGEIFKRKCTSF